MIENLDGQGLRDELFLEVKHAVNVWGWEPGLNFPYPFDSGDYPFAPFDQSFLCTVARDFYKSHGRPVPLELLNPYEHGYDIDIMWPIYQSGLEGNQRDGRYEGLIAIIGMEVEHSLYGEESCERLAKLHKKWQDIEENGLRAMYLENGGVLKSPSPTETSRKIFEETNVRREAQYEIERRLKSPSKNTSVKPDILLICSRCQQLNKQALMAGRDTPEPLWRCALSITKHSSPDASYDISCGYDDFIESEMKSKLDGIDKPFRCSTFENANPSGCEGCKFKGYINTPISLGYQYEPSLRGVA